MHPTDQEIARRLLTAVLERMEGGGQSRLSGLEAFPPRRCEPGIFIVVVGQSSDQSGIVENRPLPSEIAGMETPHRNNGAESHPGLEKFPLLEMSVKDASSRTCFMEPDRVCVNSGACEMRGY